MKKQSFITILLTLLISMTGAKAFAHDIEVVNSDGVTIYYVWTNNNTELAVSYQGTSSYQSLKYSGTVTIPEKVEYDGNTYNVTAIGNSAFSGCSGLTSVSIPQSVTSIGVEAFRDCIGLTSIDIPASVTTLGDYAFNYCSGLTSITIPNGVTCISMGLFNGCSGLTSIDIPATVTTFGECAFSGCSSLTSFSIPSNQTCISSGLFQDCSGLTSIDIPVNVTIIEDYAFSNCSGLTTLAIPANVTTLGDFAFANCSGLTSINIPTNVTSMGESVFRSCIRLTSIDISSNVTSIGDYAFYDCSSLSSVTIPRNVASIGNYSFALCSNLTSVDIEGATSIGSYAFYYCKNLTSVTIPNSVTKIGYRAFDGCNLESLVIPEHIKKRTIHVEQAGTLSTLITADDKYYIEELTLTGELNGTDLGLLRDMAGGGDFETMDIGILTNRTSGHLRVLDLSDVNIVAGGKYVNYIINEDDGRWRNLPDYLALSKDNEIPDLLFCGCGLSDIILPNSVTAIGSSVFASKHPYDIYTEGLSNLTSVVIGKSVTSITSSAFYSCNKLTSIKVNSDNQKYDSRNDCNAIIETSSNTLILGCKNTIIPNSVTSIGGSAFSDCSSLTSVTIPNSVTSIGDWAFYNCSSLTSVAIGNSVTSIGNGAFGSCSSLTSIKVEGGNVKYDSRNNCNAIIETSSNTLIHGCKNTIIPNSVTSIGNGAFYNCTSLTSITIPNSVTSIGGGAFDGCSDLTSLVIDNKEPFAIESYTFSNRANATLYVSKGSKAAYEAADYWKEFKEIKEFAMDEEVTCALEEDNTATVTAANDPTEKDVVIPENVIVGEESHPVTTIGENAFKDNTELALVCIPETIEEIGNNAFAGCSGLTAIYSYSEEPIALDGGKATVRTRADGNEVPASNIFAEVNKNTCILYVPKNCGDKYRAAVGWGEFENIVEMKSNKPGDANNDGEVDGKDVDATVGYIMEGKTENFIFMNADVKTDSKINAADIVKITNIFTEKK